MGFNVIDWQKIKNDYLENALTHSELATKYMVNINSIKKHASAEKWTEARAAWRMEEHGGNRLDRLSALSEAVIGKVERAVKELEKDFQKGELLETGIVDTGRLRQIIQSIKDLRDISSANESKRADASKLYEALEGNDDA